MAQMAMAEAARVPKNFRTVITAAAAGNVIEWYDFYIFGSLATILSVKFFGKEPPRCRPARRSRCSPPGSSPSVGGVRVRLAGSRVGRNIRSS
jgi:hypothetical protein